MTNDENKNIDVQELKIQEILMELSECREDERACRNQIFTILTLVITLLSVVVVVLFSVEEGQTLDIKIQLIINAFATFMLCAAISYIANLGFLSTFRHFYVIELEKKLMLIRNDGDDFLHWESLSTPLITFNYKKILAGLPMLYGINNAISFLSILLVAIIYILFIHLFIKTFNIINIIIGVYFWIVFFIVIFTMIVCSSKNREVYKLVKERAWDRVLERKYDTNISKRTSIMVLIEYFIYPRKSDVQKNLFIVFGFVLGSIINWFLNSNTDIFVFLKEMIIQFIFTWFIMDFLVYQARYQWNDIRGLFEDRKHPLKVKRKRLPETDIISDKYLILLSIVIMCFRLVTAWVLIVLYAKSSKELFIISVVLLFVISGIYEFVREKKNASLILFFVTLGYPLRFFMGFVGAYPFIYNVFTTYPKFIIIFVAILISAAFFGEVFVSLTWVHEAIYFAKKGLTTKSYYDVLMGQFDKNRLHHKYPMEYKDKTRNIWNICFVASHIFLMVAIIYVQMLENNDASFLVRSILLASCSLFIMFKVGECENRKKKQILQFILYAILIFEIILAVFQMSDIVRVLYIFLCVQRISYSITYIMFRSMNYEGLIGFGNNKSSQVGSSISKVIKGILGEDVYNEIKK